MRDQLRAVREGGGRIPEAYVGNPLPAGAGYVLDWFRELQYARTSNGFSMNPLTYSEIGAWATLTGRRPVPFEVQLLRDLDMAYMAAVAKRREERDKTQ